MGAFKIHKIYLENGIDKDLLNELKSTPCHLEGYEFVGERFYFRGDINDEYDYRIGGYIYLKTFLNDPKGILVMLHKHQLYYIKDFDGYRIFRYSKEHKYTKEIIEEHNWFDPPF